MSMLISLIFALHLGNPSVRVVWKGIELGAPNMTARAYAQFDAAMDSLYAIAFNATLAEEPFNSGQQTELQAFDIEERRLQEERSGRGLRVVRWLGPVGGCLISPLVWLIVAAVYKSKVTDQRAKNFAGAPGQNGGAWKYGTFDCCSDCGYCLHGWFCPFIRAADTYQGANLDGYWKVLLLGVGSYFLGQVLSTLWGMFAFALVGEDMDLSGLSSIFALLTQGLLALYLAGLRGKLAEKFGIAHSFLQDCCCWMWCACCTAIQEGRQFDEGTSTRVDCCCALSKLANGPIVGGPVVVGQVVGNTVK